MNESDPTDMGKKADALATMMQAIAQAALDDSPAVLLTEHGEQIQVMTFGAPQQTLALLYIAHRLYKDSTDVPEGVPIQ